MKKEKECKKCGRVYKKETDFLQDTGRWRVCDKGILWLNCKCGSTLMLMPGQYEWYSPDKQMSDEAASVFNTLQNKDKIPHVSSGIMEVQQLLADPDTSVPKLAKAIRNEPITASMLVNSANNQKIGSGKKIESIEHAIVYVGRESLKELIMMAGLRSFQTSTKRFKLDNFWRDSMMTGLLCERFAAKYATHVPPDHAYLAGSLANIGKLLSAILFPEETDIIFRESKGGKTTNNWRNIELQRGNVSHVVLGEIAAVFWGLPDYVRDSAANHHTIDKLMKNEQLSVTDLTAAAVQALHFVKLEAYEIDEEILKKFAGRIGVEMEQLEDYMGELRSTAESLKV